MVTKSISAEQLAAEETLLQEVCAVPSLRVPADGPGSPRLGAGGALAPCCAACDGLPGWWAAAPRGARQHPSSPAGQASAHGQSGSGNTTCSAERRL